MWFLIGIFLLIVTLSVVTLAIKGVAYLWKIRSFICVVQTDIGEFRFYQRVKNSYILKIWLKNNDEWFRGMVSGVVEYLRIRGISVDMKKIHKPVYVKFKDVGNVGYKDISGTWVRCYGFQKCGYIEIEWSVSFLNEYVKDLLRHEVTHYLIYCVYPNLSEKAHHEIMNS